MTDTAAPAIAAQIVAHDDRHVDGVEPRQRLADLHRAEKALVVEPAFLAHQVFAQIGDGAAAEAQPSREQEDPEQRQQARMEIGLTPGV